MSRHWPRVALPIPSLTSAPHFGSNSLKIFLSIRAPKPDALWTPGSENVLHSLACAMAAHSTTLQWNSKIISLQLI